MMMKDIESSELDQIERASRKSSNSNEVSDKSLIDMVQKIREGKLEEVSKQANQNMVKPKIVEPEVAQFQQSPLEAMNSSSNANYWKITGLPSKGKFYPNNEIMGRPLKVLEVKKISSISEENGDFILNDIVKRTTKGIALEEMYVADKLFIIFWLRANTYRESGYTVPFVCNKCGKSSEYHFEINNIEVQQISDEFDPKKEIKLINGEFITFDYLKVKDELYIDKFKEYNTNAIGEIDKELLAMAQMIKTIDGKEKTLMEKYYWLVELNPGDYSYLRTFMEKKGMGIKPYINVTCKECGGTAVVAVSFREEFFIPQFKFE